SVGGGGGGGGGGGPEPRGGTAAGIARGGEAAAGGAVGAPRGVGRGVAGWCPATTAASAPRTMRSTSRPAIDTRPASGPSVSRTLPYKPPGTNSARASMSAARSITPRTAAASTSHGAADPSAAHATPPLQNAGAPSSPSARAVARHTETYDTIALDERTTRIRSDAGNLLMAAPRLVPDVRD